MNNRPELRILDENCGTRKVLELLSPKWRILILCALGDGPHRYNDLLKRIDGIAQKVLTQSLKGMEADGPIIRRSNSTPPRGVVYTLAPLVLSSTSNCSGCVSGPKIMWSNWMVNDRYFPADGSTEGLLFGQGYLQRTLFRSPQQISAPPCAETDSWRSVSFEA